MTDIETFKSFLQSKTPMVAMLAPSFPIVYEFPQIVGKLKRLGFDFVFEVSAGAHHTNQSLVKAFRENKNARFITAPCPTIVRTIRQKYPQLNPYLALKVDSPMVATAKIIHELHPNHKPVFIGPCVSKKFEASEDYPELNLLVLTYKELNQIFSDLNLPDDSKDNSADFDFRQAQTRLYPISGGLAQSCGIEHLLSTDEVEVVSGWQNAYTALEKFEKDTKIKLLDILFCEGGCVNGPGIDSPLSLEDRRKKVVAYWAKGIA